MRRAIDAIGIVLGVVALSVLAIAVLPGVPFGALRRTSLLIVVLAVAGLTYVTIGLIRRSRDEDAAETSTTLVSAGAALMTFAAIYAVLINETVD